MSTETDRKLYELFERIIREARDADVYDVTLTGKGANGSDYTYGIRLKASEKNQIPWKTVDGIRCVEWYPGGDPSQQKHPGQGDPRHVRVGYHGFYRGITVYSDLTESNYPLCDINYRTTCEILGVAGTIKLLADCVALADEDAVVRRVLEIIEQAYTVYEDERKEIRFGEENYDDMWHERSLADEY